MLKKFKQFLAEALDLSKFELTPGKKKVNIFIGRLQPPHKIHIKRLIDGDITELFLVKGAKSDPAKSPFPFEIQEELIKAIFKNKVRVYPLQSAFIGDVINILRKENKEPSKLFCGTDREATYKDQVKRYSKDLNMEMTVEVFDRVSTDTISGTDVRNSLKNSDEEAGFADFQKYMPAEVATKDWYNKLKKYVQ